MKLFVCYAHEDQRYREALWKHAYVLRPRIDLWSDVKIVAGRDWRREIDRALGSCDAAVLLISKDFLSSEFIQSVELKRLIARSKAESFDLIPVVVEACAWEKHAALASLQVRPPGGMAIAQLAEPEQNAAWKSIVDELDQIARTRVLPKPLDVLTNGEGVELRPWRPYSSPPGRLYPSLEPYRDPRRYRGRERELRDILAQIPERLIVAVHAPSGAGKSSFLLAALEPALREMGRATVVVRHPAEARLGIELIRGLIGKPELAKVTEAEPLEFAAWMRVAREKTGHAPVLILDQFEDVFLSSDPKASTRVGLLIAATAEHAVGQDYPCQWILGFREEYLARFRRWLKNITEGAGDIDLPPDLSQTDRVWEIALSQIAALPVCADRLEKTASVFQEIIEAPFAVGRSDWSWAEGEARRVAELFAKERIGDSEALLLVELQVVLDALVEGARARGERVLRVDDETFAGGFLRAALKRHLGSKIALCFADLGEEALRDRTRALFLLKALADAKVGMSLSSAGEMLGKDANRILDELASDRIRLVVRDTETASQLPWVRIIHDQVADEVHRIFADPDERVKYRLDAELTTTLEVVKARVSAFAQNDATMLRLDSGLFARVGRLRDAGIWSAAFEPWFVAATASFRSEKRRRRRSRIVAVAACVLMIGLMFGATTNWAQVKFLEWFSPLESVGAQRLPGAIEAVGGYATELVRRGRVGEALRVFCLPWPHEALFSLFGEARPETLSRVSRDFARALADRSAFDVIQSFPTDYCHRKLSVELVMLAQEGAEPSATRTIVPITELDLYDALPAFLSRLDDDQVIATSTRAHLGADAIEYLAREGRDHALDGIIAKQATAETRCYFRAHALIGYASADHRELALRQATQLEEEFRAEPDARCKVLATTSDAPLWARAWQEPYVEGCIRTIALDRSGSDSLAEVLAYGGHLCLALEHAKDYRSILRAFGEGGHVNLPSCARSRLSVEQAMPAVHLGRIFYFLDPAHRDVDGARAEWQLAQEEREVDVLVLFALAGHPEAVLTRDWSGRLDFSLTSRFDRLIEKHGKHSLGFALIEELLDRGDVRSAAMVAKSTARGLFELVIERGERAGSVPAELMTDVRDKIDKKWSFNADAYESLGLTEDDASRAWFDGHANLDPKMRCVYAVGVARRGRGDRAVEIAKKHGCNASHDVRLPKVLGMGGHCEAGLGMFSAWRPLELAFSEMQQGEDIEAAFKTAEAYVQLGEYARARISCLKCGPVNDLRLRTQILERERTGRRCVD